MSLTPLQLPPGLVRLNSAYDTPGRWFDCNQVRWVSGVLCPTGGWERVTSTALDKAVRKIFVWRNLVNDRNLISGTDGKLYVNSGGTWTDITPSGFVGPGAIGVGGGYGTGDYGEETYGDARDDPSPVFSPFAFYSAGNWGEDLILCANSDGDPYYYDQTNTTTAPTKVSAASGASNVPTGISGLCVTAERSLMTFKNRTVLWSSLEDYTDFDTSSTTNTAGTFEVTSSSNLLTGYVVNGGVLAFSHTDVFLIEYKGDPFIYGGQTPIAKTRMFNPASVAVFGNGKAVWLSGLGFQLYANGVVQTLPCPILADILGTDTTHSMDPIYGPFRCHGSANGVFPEITWFYPSVGKTECNRYVTWNYEDNIWYWGAMERSAMAAADAYRYPYMGASDGNIYQHEVGFLAENKTRVGTIFVESGALSGGDETMALSQLLLATGQGAQSVTAKLFGRFTPEGTEYTFGPFTPRADGYTDARCEARALRLRIEAAQDGPFGIGVIKGDLVPGSGR